VDDGRASFTHSWDQALHLDFAYPALPYTVNAALESAVATPPDTAALRALLASR
jgi:hypothetical protein